MKLPSFKTILLGLSLIAGMAFVSSCNKGYGCPTDFSVDAVDVTPQDQTAC